MSIKQDMLGPVVRALVGVPREYLGVVLDAINKLGSKDGELWKARLSTVLREGVKKTVETKHIIDCDAEPFVPDGWSVEEHKKGGKFEWEPNDIKLYFSDNQKDSRKNFGIDGNDLRKELEDQYVLNANILDYLLTNQRLIPEEWKGKYVFFWGTIYRLPDGALSVRYLCWRGGEWRWDDYWLGGNWGYDDPAVVLAS